MAMKKLIEVALPLEAINTAAAREKKIRHGHPSNLHPWWARRPLAAARAVIWASLVDDPSSHPDLFSTEREQIAERERLFNILSDLVLWENSNNEQVLAAARAEISASVGENLPQLLDPFAGGGAIPLEAQRLGLDAFAQDLNPVPVTINKAIIEIPSLFQGVIPVNPKSRSKTLVTDWPGNTGIADDVEYYANWIKAQAIDRIGSLYPQVEIPKDQGNGYATVISWIWTRTVRCPSPACSCEVPLVKSFDLAKRKGKEWHVEPIFDGRTLDFKVARGKSTTNGTVNRKGAICIHCGSPIDFPYIRQEGSAGRIGERLMAIVAEGKRGRIFVNPSKEHATTANVARPEDTLSCELVGKSKVNVGNYGYRETTDLFSNRQLTMLATFSGLVPEAQRKATKDAIDGGMTQGEGLANRGTGALAYGEAIGVLLAFLINKLADLNNALNLWEPVAQCPRNLFARQAIPMTWTHAEANPLSNSSGSWDVLIKNLKSTLLSDSLNFGRTGLGVAAQADAQEDNGMRNIMVSTDPPYYDNIDYADLSDFFYVWLRQSLRGTFPDLFRTISTPKTNELVASAYREYGEIDARTHFETGMLSVFKHIYSYSREDIPVSVYYGYKQSETETQNTVEKTASTGWETMLSAAIKAGFVITGTWPMRTEMISALKKDMNALASSIVLVCRKREVDADSCTRRDFVSALKRELRPALEKLQQSNIAPVDLAQCAIGPGIGIYSRYNHVFEADGTEMTVRSALQIINQELDLYFSDQDNELDRESRFCLDLYTQSAFNEIRFGEADVLARAKNTSIEGIAAKGALSSAKGVVRLLGRDEIRDMPAPDFCWLFTQQLTHAMETGGNDACATMLKDIYDGRSENAKALAYRLFTIADKKGWAQEAFAYNSLVVAWPDIQTKAAQLQQETPVQTALDI